MSNSNILISLKNDLFKTLELGDMEEVIKMINSILGRVDPITKDIPYKDLEEIVIELIKKDSTILNMILNRAPLLDSTNIEIFKNFYLFEGERIIKVFWGKVFIKSAVVAGLVVLTNYRIWTGRKFKVGSGGGRTIFGNIITLLLSAVIDSIQKSITKNLLKAMQDENVMEWGTSIPVNNAKNIIRKRKEISYSILIDTEKGQNELKIKVGLLDVKIMKKFLSRTKDLSEIFGARQSLMYQIDNFQNEQEFILSKIEELLHQLQI